MKGIIKPDHIPTNKFKVLIPGLIPITATTISGIEDELETTDLPDRTKASGGNRGPTEVVLGVPTHHIPEQAVIELWFQESQDPISPTYKKAGSIVFTSGSGSILRTFTAQGMFPTKRTLPEGDIQNEGEISITEWTFSIDDLLPI